MAAHHERESILRKLHRADLAACSAPGKPRPAVLDLTLCVREGTEKQAAHECFARMTQAEWTQMVALAAEVVMLQEHLATGQVFLVAPVHRDHLAAVVRAR